MDLNDIDLERWREILPLAAELIHGDAEIMTQSPSQTVSIYEALAEILSKPTESLNLFNNKSTDRTLFSEAPISSTSTSTTTTSTTSTRVKYDDTKVDRVNKKSEDTPVYIQENISHSLNSLNSHDTTRNTKSTSLNSLSDLLMSFDESTNNLFWSNIFDTNNETNGKRVMTRELPKIDLMTRRIGSNDMEMTSSSFYPVYVPKKIGSTIEMTLPTTPLPLTTRRVVYTILPNNTFEKKNLRQHKGHEDIMHSRLNNGTLVNGTQVADDIEITTLIPVQLNKNKSHESATTENIETVFPFKPRFFMHSHRILCSYSACTILNVFI